MYHIFNLLEVLSSSLIVRICLFVCLYLFHHVWVGCMEREYGFDVTLVEASTS